MRSSVLLASMPLSAPVFDPATLSLTGWWRASYTSGSPWTPTASAGSSGSNGNLAEGSNPPADGATQHSLVPADFDGTNDKLTSAHDATTFLTVGAGSVWALFRGNASPPAVSAGYDEPSIFTDGNADFALTFTSSGVGFVLQDGGGFKVAYVAASSAAYHLAQMKWDGTNMRYRVDSGSWTNLSAGNIATLAYPMQAGPNWNAVAFFAGRILEIGSAASALSDGTFDNIKAYCNSRYSLSL